MQQVLRFPSVTASAIAASSLETTCRLKIESVERFSGDIGKVRQELEEAGTGQEVLVVCQTEAEARRLADLFGGTPLAGAGKLHFPIGHLKHGFRLVPEGIVLLASGELFHREDLRRPVRRRLSRAIDSFVELREGDLVVHVSHGIARYRGIKLLEKNQQAEEHLVIWSSQGGTKLYVPSAKIGPGAEVRGRGEEPAAAGQAGRAALGPAEAGRPAGGHRHGRRDARAAGGAGLAAGHRLSRGHRMAAGVRGLLPLPGDRRPAGQRIEAIKHDMAQPQADGPPALRRRRLRQDGDGHAGGVQGGGRRQAGGRAGAHHRAGRAAPADLSGRMAEYPFEIASPVAFRHARPAGRDHRAAGGRRGRHRHRHAPAGAAGRAVQRPGAGGHRRGAAVRRRGQGAAQGAAADGRRADDDRHAHPAHAAHVAAGASATSPTWKRRRRTAWPSRPASAASTPS